MPYPHHRIKVGTGSADCSSVHFVLPRRSCLGASPLDSSVVRTPPPRTGGRKKPDVKLWLFLFVTSPYTFEEPWESSLTRLSAGSFPKSQ